MSGDDDFYDLWEEEDKPDNNMEKVALENARLRAQLEAASKGPVEKFYIVRGFETFVCHKSQFEIKRQKDKSGNIVRDITAKGARMVRYGKDGMRKVDR